jgi:hypothetical protein
MPDLRDPRALVRHAAQAGDLPLLALVAQRLSGRATNGPATRAFVTLVSVRELAVIGADDSADA